MNDNDKKLKFFYLINKSPHVLMPTRTEVGLRTADTVDAVTSTSRSENFYILNLNIGNAKNSYLYQILF